MRCTGPPGTHASATSAPPDSAPATVPSATISACTATASPSATPKTSSRFRPTIRTALPPCQRTSAAKSTGSMTTPITANAIATSLVNHAAQSPSQPWNEAASGERKRRQPRPSQPWTSTRNIAR